MTSMNWCYPEDHPIFLGAWTGAVIGALTANDLMITFLCASVGVIIGAVVYRQDLLRKNYDEHLASYKKSL